MSVGPTNRRRLVTAALLAPIFRFVLIGFVMPLSELFGLSFSDRRGALKTYADLLNGEIYRKVFVNTVVMAASVTAISVALAYPVAWALSRLRGKWFTIAFWCVLVPFWVSVLVRTFSWMLLLEKNGPLNRVLTMLTGAETSLALLFSGTAVLISMTHVMVPYAVLPIYATMVHIDGRLLLASDGLGATPFTTFRRVYLPLSTLLALAPQLHSSSYYRRAFSSRPRFSAGSATPHSRC